MKTFVCFGDSNTWGYVAGTDRERYPRESRWPVQLAARLGDEWEVISEGLNGRTATVERPDREGGNGLPYLVPCLRSHAPVDVVAIFLGTNDVNFMTEFMVARSVERLHKVARNSEAGAGYGAPNVLAVCPPPFAGFALGPFFASEVTCPVVDLDGITSYPIVGDDVEHLDAEGHAAVALAVAERVRALGW
jgi:lysophospholipase L1-like esterase